MSSSSEFSLCSLCGTNSSVSGAEPPEARGGGATSEEKEDEEALPTPLLPTGCEDPALPSGPSSPEEDVTIGKLC